MIPRQKNISLGLLVATLLAAPFAGSLHAEDKPFTDKSRLVSVGGAITEIIYALGEQGHLVARDTTSNFPGEVSALPDIGYMRALSPEGLLSVRPTAVLLVEGSGPREAVETLERSGVAIATIPEGFDRNAIGDKIRTVGLALGVAEKAEVLARKVDGEVETAAARAATIPASERKRVLFILSAQGGKIMAAGSHSAADAIITLAGGINAASGFAGYKLITDEAIIGARPDVVLMMDRGGDHAMTGDALFGLPAVALTPAAKKKALIRMDGLTLLGFGPRTGQAISTLSAQLYPALAHD